MTETSAAPAPRRHIIYGELLGKGGPYGIGWEIAISRRLAFGAVGSVSQIRDQRLYMIAPYLHATIIGGKRHALFGELGFVLAHSRLASPVPEWDGMNDTGAGGQATIGWEWRRGRFVGRTYLGAALGEGGLAPFLGLVLGVAL